MNELLDSVLANTKVGPKIVSEVHDLGQIRVDSGSVGLSTQQQIDRLKSGAAMWDEAEYGMTRQEQIARLEAANTPEAQAKELEAMKARAVRRAGLDSSNGKIAVMVAGEVPWHGLGVNVESAVTSEDAIRLASLNWKVEKIQLQYVNPVTKEINKADGKWAIVRNDTGNMLGTVGDVYKPFQNEDGFKFLDDVIGQFDAKYESAGAIYGGSQVWMLVHLPKLSFSVNGSDRIENYALFTNCHDGTKAARCFPTSQRVVCANTFRIAQSDADKGLTIRHTGNLRARVDSAKNALGIAVKGFQEYRENADTLARINVDPIPYFDGILDAVLEITKADALKGADALAAAIATNEADKMIAAAQFKREIKKREVTLEDVLARYESGTNGVNGMRGTGWAALNAVTESADHGKLAGRQVGDDKKSRRFESVISGASDEIKQIAYEQVMQFASIS